MLCKLYNKYMYFNMYAYITISTYRGQDNLTLFYTVGCQVYYFME